MHDALRRDRSAVGRATSPPTAFARDACARRHSSKPDLANANSVDPHFCARRSKLLIASSTMMRSVRMPTIDLLPAEVIEAFAEGLNATKAFLGGWPEL